MKKLFKNTFLVLFAFILVNCSSDDSNSQQEPTTVTDIDGNVYNTIKIGNQTWMLENLKVTTFNDGAPITQYSFAEFGNNWLNLNTPNAFYQWANTDDLNNVVDEELPFDYYGAMYNHLAIESGKLAPEGWRIPSEQDFIELENYLTNNGYSGNEATALKSATGWLESSGNGTDAIGFRALPNGYINAFGGPTFSEGTCTWATSNVSGDNLASQTRIMVQLFDQNTILYGDNAIQIGAGIRCIKE